VVLLSVDIAVLRVLKDGTLSSWERGDYRGERAQTIDTKEHQEVDL
jgi:hypothetical protein